MIKMHVCIDKYLRTESLAEISSKQGITEAHLLQVWIKNIFLTVWTIILSLSISRYCQGHRSVVWNKTEQLFYCWKWPLISWALVLRGHVQGWICPLPFSLQDTSLALQAGLSVSSTFFLAVDKPIALTRNLTAL